ncbi:MAG: 3-hydroxyacyl-CoA dehydrogenase family protein [Syntrophomonadales bacterium]|jgi:3-hydroxybutyryl-CoA dehydrogenase
MIDRIEKVGVLGAGLMGHGIAQLAAQAGCQVVLVDVSEQELQKGWAKIQKLWNKDVEKGKLTPEQLDGLTKLIDTSLDINDFADCDVVIEAIPEIMELKKETFTKLDQIVKPDAILATNTSQLSITEIATATNRPDKVIGMHFFYPAQVMRLIEIPMGEHTSQGCVDLIVDLSRRMKKETCVCRDTPGFIVNRLLAGLMVEASRVYDERLASIEEIDKAMKFALGHPMGPFQLFDFSGIDTMVRVADGLRAAFGDRFCIGIGTRNKVRAGDFGQKTGRGFYEY